jgi:hypothetical protein
MTVVHIRSCDALEITSVPRVFGGQGIIHHQYRLGVVADIRGQWVSCNVTLGWQFLIIVIYSTIPTDADQGYSILSVP